MGELNVVVTLRVAVESTVLAYHPVLAAVWIAGYCSSPAAAGLDCKLLLQSKNLTYGPVRAK